jgi:hypothetical protein
MLQRTIKILRRVCTCKLFSLLTIIVALVTTLTTTTSNAMNTFTDTTVVDTIATDGHDNDSKHIRYLALPDINVLMNILQETNDSYTDQQEEESCRVSYQHVCVCVGGCHYRNKNKSNP